MRVISGSAKKRILKMPRGGKVRPTADRVKEALFNILGPLILDAQVLDLYAGSGALGIEALSRGGALCVFVEKERKVIATLRKNLQITDFAGKSELIINDVKKALLMLSKKDRSFDLVFMDPPYGKKIELETLIQIAQLPILKSGGIVVVESFVGQPLPETISPLLKIRFEKYGDTVLSFYKKQRGGLFENSRLPR